MHRHNQQILYSPSDLTRYMESPFASWMDRFALEHTATAPQKDPPDALMSALADKGFAHEDEVQEQFSKQGCSVIKIEGATSNEKLDKTLRAIQQGTDVIVQAYLQLDTFAGYADFLVKVKHEAGEKAGLLGDFHYEVWDTKLANKLKPAFVIQLCCYAEMLSVIQGRLSEFITVALGDGTKQRLQTGDYYYYYRSLKNAFLQDQMQFNAEAMPDPADSKSWADWSQVAEQILMSKDHLFQVANISKSQIKKLNRAGFTTMQQLANSDLEQVKGLHPAAFKKLKAQAAIQKQTAAHCHTTATPSFEILPHADGQKAGLALLPPHSPQDVFFDIEGYPLDEGGLEYLWGCTYFTDSKRVFRDFWAHNRQQEKQAFEDFIRWVYQRWLQDSTLHIYHYANYEIAACRKLMGRYGVCEFELDQLLRNEVFVDLYKIVKGGLLLGEPRYSIKNVEHLYRGKRQTLVGSGGDSVVVYERWRELHRLGEQGDSWQSSAILKDIREYNIDDCNSTQELVDWLRQQQTEHGIEFLGKTETTEPEIKEEREAIIQLRDSLLEAAATQLQTNPAQAQLTENLAWMLEFHRREAKPVFWRLFDRLGLSELELMDDLDCLAGCTRTEKDAFKPSPRARNLAYEYRFDPNQEFKGASQQFYLLGMETEDGKAAKVSMLEQHSDLENGIIVLQAKQEPPARVSLVPDEYVNPTPIPQAIEKTVQEFASGVLSFSNCAILDFLMRRKPRFKPLAAGDPDAQGAIADSPDPQQRLQQIIHAIRQLDNSYLTIQGPPGAGKSYTGKHVIAELVKSGARVGITSNSHKAVNNLLLSTAKYCKKQKIAATFGCTKDTEPALAENEVAILKNNELIHHLTPGCVLGTTAWGFARDELNGQFDYLFVDEAGQVAVANLIAMSRAANNLILMGDQMQLGQPSQGSHPAESGLSVLDYLLHDSATIADDMGVFLGTTYRMHSSINQFISEHIYEGKLHAHPANDKRVIEVPSGYAGVLNREAGLLFVPVVHEGNTQASDEEVAAINSLAHELLGRTFHTGDEKETERPIDWNDMLFVAPYNHQVSKLRTALGEHARVGSVDKFQGQEAPIVFFSLCASDASESPRGLDFLFDRHRINVAISRAQTLAIVVGNPAIANTAVTRVDQLKLVNLFSAIVLR